MTVLKNLLADLEVPDDQVYVPQPTMPGLPVEPGWRLVRGDQPASVALVGLSTVDAVSEAVGQVAAEIGSGTAILVVDRQVGELPTGRMLTALAEHDLLVTQMVELTNARVGVAMVLTRDRSQAPLSPAFGEPVDLLTAGDRLRNEWLVEGFAARAATSRAVIAANEERLRYGHERRAAATRIAALEEELERERRENAALRASVARLRAAATRSLPARARKLSAQARTDPVGAAATVARFVGRRVRSSGRHGEADSG